MPPPKTALDRYNQSLAAIQAVDGGLANHVDITIPRGRQLIGADLSLTGYKWYATFGSTDTGHAVRALMLCQEAYFGTHWSRVQNGLQVNWHDVDKTNSRKLTKDHYLGKSTAVVNDAIRSFTLPLAAPVVATLADTAQQLGQCGPGVPKMELMARANPVPTVNICYDAVAWWLFKAGFTSLRWMLRKGMTIDARNANTILGNGVVQQRAHDGTVPDIPRGMIIYWKGDSPDTEHVCHWAVSLGNRQVVGVNNNGGIAMATGNHQFGTFPLDSAWTLYEGDITYSNQNHRSGVIVGAIDPTTIPHRNTGA